VLYEKVKDTQMKQFLFRFASGPLTNKYLYIEKCKKRLGAALFVDVFGALTIFASFCDKSVCGLFGLLSIYDLQEYSTCLAQT